jgi:hypothetical protein
MTRQDWRKISTENVAFRPQQLKNELLPYLRKSAEDEFDRLEPLVTLVEAYEADVHT